MKNKTPRNVSPLRYPGGKSSFSEILKNIRASNGLQEFDLAEPYGGGAGASLTLLVGEEVPRICINDADPSIFAFWKSMLSMGGKFSKMVANSRPTIREWKRQKSYYDRKGRKSLLKFGFSAFFLNRCNHSGVIVNGGPIGGMDQKGKWKVSARYNSLQLAGRCRLLQEYANRINVSGLDGVEFLRKFVDTKTMFFVDPPYFHKGKTLYLNDLGADYHQQLASVLKEKISKPWVVTYDDCAEIRSFYKGWARITPFSLRYTASTTKVGREVMITPPWMIIPKSCDSAMVSWT